VLKEIIKILRESSQDESKRLQFLMRHSHFRHKEHLLFTGLWSTLTKEDWKSFNPSYLRETLTTAILYGWKCSFAADKLHAQYYCHFLKKLLELAKKNPDNMKTGPPGWISVLRCTKEWNSMRMSQLKGNKAVSLTIDKHTLISVQLIFRNYCDAIVWDNDTCVKLHNRIYCSMEQKIPKVFNYFADPWQTELLNYARPAENFVKSCLVCAPTSSGKTFICREIMRRFAAHYKDGLVVYLCPTKALAAMVFRDLTEWLYKGQNEDPEPISGLFTKDLRIRVENCHILVIIPEILEILTLGAFGNTWREKISCVVIDEAHYIGETERGPVLERFFAMLRCPFYAFSATISGADNFLAWLQDLGHSVIAIGATEEAKIPRATDLEFFLFDPLKMGGSIIPLHPFALLQSTENVYSLVSNLPYLLPQHIIPTLEALGEEGRREVARRLNDSCNYGTVSSKDLFEMLCQKAEVSFPILRKSVQQLDNMLRETLLSIAEDELNNLSSMPILPSFLQEIRKSTEKTWMNIDKFNSRNKRFIAGPNAKCLHIIYKRLAADNLLPAMFFFFSKKALLNTTMAILNYIPELPAVVMRERLNLQKTITEWNNPAYQDRDPSMLRKDFDHLLGCLKRGFALHYAGYPVAIRTRIELLFSSREIDVVFCTTTLATGVHTPCKTVVVCEDSARFLTPIEFHQLIGRAGRRNKDSIGRVIITRLSFARCQTLSTTRFRDITGAVGLSISTILRLVACIKSSTNLSVNDITSLKMMLEKPLFLNPKYEERFGRNLRTKYYNMIHLSLIVLYKLNLLDAGMTPMDMYMLVSRIPYAEPYIICLSFLLQRGLIPIDSPHATASTILRILAPSSAEIYLTHSLNKKEASGTLEGYLVQLPQKVIRGLADYNELIVTTAKFFISSFNEPMERSSELLRELLPVSYEFFKTSEKDSTPTILTPNSPAAIFGPHVCRTIPEKQENTFGFLDLLAKGARFFSGALPFIDVHKIQKHEYHVLLPDMLYYPFLSPNDIVLLFGQTWEYHFRQIDAALDLLKRVKIALEVFSKAITTLTSQGEGVKVPAFALRTKAYLDKVCLHINTVQRAYFNWKNVNLSPTRMLTKRGIEIIFSNDEDTQEGSENEENSDEDDSEEEEEGCYLDHAITESELISAKLHRRKNAKPVFPWVISLCIHSLLDHPTAPYTITNYPLRYVPKSGAKGSFSHCWVLTQNEKNRPTIHIIYENLGKVLGNEFSRVPAQSTKKKQHLNNDFDVPGLGKVASSFIRSAWGWKDERYPNLTDHVLGVLDTHTFLKSMYYGSYLPLINGLVNIFKYNIVMYSIPTNAPNNVHDTIPFVEFVQESLHKHKDFSTLTPPSTVVAHGLFQMKVATRSYMKVPRFVGLYNTKFEIEYWKPPTNLKLLQIPHYQSLQLRRQEIAEKFHPWYDYLLLLIKQ
jgi:hypothetical protein